MTYKHWQGPIRPVSNGAKVVRLALASNDDAPRRARAAFAPLHGSTDVDMLERAELLTSELVSNSVKHAGGSEVRVDIWPGHGSLSVVVTDDGAGFTPVAQPTTIAENDGGIGLPLVDILSEAWGSGCDGEAWVWFQVSPRLEAAGRTQQLLDMRMVVDSVKGRALIALDPDGNITNWGAGAVALTGYSAEERLGRHLSELYLKPSVRAFARERVAVEFHGSHQSERWLRRRDGSRVWVEVELSPILDRAGERRGLSALISDSTNRKRSRESTEHVIAELREQAMSDDLTGLPNRRRWQEELDRELARSRRLGTPLAVAMLDLDGFKAYNDAHGHPAGDEILRSVARCWSEGMRGSDMLARIGGDEFSITLPDCSPELALTVVARVQAATPPGIKSSAGIASSDGTETADGLVARADAALYAAKGDALPVAVAVADS